MISIRLKQAEMLLECFGGEDATFIVQHCEEGHSGPGLYAWVEDCPEDGSTFLGDPEKDEL